MRRQLIASAIALVCLGSLAAAVAGCGGGTSARADQPTSGESAFIAGDFTDLPKPGDAAPLGDPTVSGGTTAQSFLVNGVSPQQILAFYASALAGAGWNAASAPAEVGDGDWQGEWARNDETLQVSASPTTGNGTSSQLDLVFTG